MKPPFHPSFKPNHLNLNRTHLNFKSISTKYQLNLITPQFQPSLNSTSLQTLALISTLCIMFCFPLAEIHNYTLSALHYYPREILSQLFKGGGAECKCCGCEWALTITLEV